MITLLQFEKMLKKEWISYFPESYQHGEVLFHEKALRNGESNMQVGIWGVSDKAPLLPVKPYYEAITQGVFAGKILKTMADDYQKCEKQRADLFDKIVAMRPQHFESMQDRITLALVNRNTNEHLLQDAAYLPFEDLAKVFYLKVNSQMHTKITKEMCSEWGVDARELEKAALDNMPRLSPAHLSDVSALLHRGECRNYLGETGELTGNLYALTNASRRLGAGAMLYPGVMEEIAQRMKTPFYIIPSSVHELIIVPKKYNISLAVAKSMVKTVNKEVVEPEDFLSNNIYCYDTKAKEIRMMQEDFEVEKPKRREQEYER